MAENVFLELVRQPWMAQASVDTIETDARARWVANLALVKGGWFARQLCSDVLGRLRYNSKEPFKSTTALIGYAYCLPDLVQQFGVPTLMSGAAADHIRHAVIRTHPPALALLDADRDDGAAVAMLFCQLITDAARSSGVKKLTDALGSAPKIFGQMGGTNVAIANLVNDGLVGGALPAPV